MLTLYYLMKNSKTQAKLSASEYYSILNESKRFKLKGGSVAKCRICLQEGSFPIYGSKDTDLYLEVIQNVGDVHVSEDDDYPKHLCEICHDFIKGAILFKKVAKESDNILKQSVKEETVYDQTSDVDTQELSDSSTCDTVRPRKWGNNHLFSQLSLKKVKVERGGRVNNYAPKVTCKICNKVINRSYIKEHMTMHDPDHKKFVCDVCGKSFRLRCAYHNHSLRHRKDFPFKCQFCPYRGKYSELLKNHMRTHTGDYRYMCTECPARFLFKSNLNKHMLKHKEPQFKCDACKRAFHTKLMLQRHFDSDHLGIKNHVCNLCGKAFGYRNAMMKHQRHVHKREKLMFGRMPAYLAAEHRVQDLGQDDS
ncbi:zinc finger protein 225-like [Trichoplusia ni]|uniref:Zinc finger protein 225-like n=1 Tax=Trichoplusia ni TaxID=7111 RepID=A0A7E5VLK6_TRINI|nr:zinc finger protein 225-like [Trichoplusia ni]